MDSAHPGWMLDERTSLGRENTDPEHVRHYDEKEDAGAAAEVALLQNLVPTDATVVDLGAGTGQFAVAASRVWPRVTAVDPSPEMLAQLRAKAAGTPLRVVEGGFLTYRHEGPSADLVYSRYALHHLPDFWKALALGRIRSMLRPGGLLRLWDIVFRFSIAEAPERIERWCTTGFSPVEGGWTRADLEEHVRDEHSTFTWLLEPMAVDAGFAIERADYSEDGIFARYLLRAV